MAAPREREVSQERVTKIRRTRKHASCIECRVRKIRCDKNVPNCSSCVQRGLQHQCRWGDERDALISPAASPSNDCNTGKRKTVENLKSQIPETHRPVEGLAHPGSPSLLVSSSQQHLAELSMSNPDEWRTMISSNLELMPEGYHMDEIVLFYLRELEPLFCCMNSVIFQDEYATLKTNIALSRWNKQNSDHEDTPNFIVGSLTGQVHQPSGSLPLSKFWADPKSYGLLALVFAVVNVVLNTMHKGEVLSRHFLPNCDSEERFDQVSEQLYSSSIFFLHESTYQLTPTLWTLQTIIILKRKPLDSLHVTLGLIWNATATRLAQLMGLNRLGSAIEDIKHKNDKSPLYIEEDPVSRMPWLSIFAEDDLPKRELGRKVWATLLTFDWFASGHVDFAYLVPDDINCSSTPAALLDEEVVRLEAIPEAVLANPNRPSPNAFVRLSLELSYIVRQTSVILTKRISRHEPLHVAYEDVALIDRQLCALVENLPNYLRFDGLSELSDEVQAIHAQHPFLSLQRLFLQEQIHFRMLRLHSPYLPSALRDPARRRSLKACIEGARVTVAVWEELQRAENPNQHMHYMKWHLLSAAFVLNRVLALVGDSWTQDAATASEYSRLKKTLRKALEFLEKRHARALETFVSIHGSKLLESIRRFCASQDPKLSVLEGSTIDSAIDAQFEPPSSNAPLSFLDEFTKLMDAVPPPIEVPSWNTDDTSLLAGLDFFLGDGDRLPLANDLSINSYQDVP